MIESLNAFKTLAISKSQLERKIGGRLYSVKTRQPVVIQNKDVMHVLEQYKNNMVSPAELANWVNVVCYTELYCYDDKHQDAIASVMLDLANCHAEGEIPSLEAIDIYIDALKNNREI